MCAAAAGAAAHSYPYSFSSLTVLICTSFVAYCFDNNNKMEIKFQTRKKNN